MKCPYCGLINPETALRCDCGYDFATKRMKESYVDAWRAAEGAQVSSEFFGERGPRTRLVERRAGVATDAVSARPYFSREANKEPDIRTREFAVDDIFTAGWRIYLGNFWKILLISLCVYIPYEILQWLFLSILEPGDEVASQLGQIAISALSLLTPIATMAIAFVVEGTIWGVQADWREALWHGLRKWPAMFGTGCVSGLIVLGLTLLLVIPGIIWAVYYNFSVLVVALRGIWGKEALDYSKDLVRGRWWRVAAILILISVLTYFASVVVAVPFAFMMVLFNAQVFLAIAEVIVSMVSALFTVITVVWFLNLDYLNNPVPAAVPGTGGEALPRMAPESETQPVPSASAAEAVAALTATAGGACAVH